VSAVLREPLARHKCLNSVGIELSAEILNERTLPAVFDFSLKALVLFSELGILSEAFLSASPDDLSISIYASKSGRYLEWKNRYPSIDETKMRYDLTRSLPRKVDYLWDVHWGNYWNSMQVARLGGEADVLCEISDCACQRLLPDGGIFFTVTPDVKEMVLGVEPKDNTVRQRRQRLREFLRSHDLLLPPLADLKREYEEYVLALTAEREARGPTPSLFRPQQETEPEFTPLSPDTPPSYLKGKTRMPSPKGPASRLFSQEWKKAGQTHYGVFDIVDGDADILNVRILSDSGGNVDFPYVCAKSDGKGGRWFPIYDARKHPSSAYHDPESKLKFSPRVTLCCSKCQGDRFQVSVGFELFDDEVTGPDDVGWFQLAVCCADCGWKSMVFEDETA